MSPERYEPDKEVDAFILSRIDTVPHLEALLLLWREQSAPWSAEGVSARLWIKPVFSEAILQELVRDHIVRVVPGILPLYEYNSEPERDQLVQRVATAYSRDMIRITRLIHSKASPAILDFARAFRLKKDSE